MGKIPDRFRNFVQKCRDISGETKKRERTLDFIDVNGVKRPRLNGIYLKGYMKLNNTLMKSFNIYVFLFYR